ncbi:MAG: ribosome maturation factor RimP [Nitrospinae bacterium]|nr:ribosome maturation factor RimP [Nitrospinota bacterium]
MSQSVTEKLRDILAPVVESEGMELVEVEYRREGRGWVIRIFIDKEGGITIEDCSLISREAGPILDVEDLIPHHYTLEVSSPGLDRPLKKLSDYQRFQGKLARINTFAPLGGRKKYLGRILGVEGESVLLHIEAEDQKVAIPLRDIAKGNLEFEF